MDDDKKDLPTTSTKAVKGYAPPVEVEAKVDAPVAEEKAAPATIDSVVDDWFSKVKKQLSRDTATRNILHSALPELKTALNEVKA